MSGAVRGAAIGVDIGGSGIKAAPVDVVTGEVLAKRTRVPTPQPSTPAAVADAVRDLLAPMLPASRVAATVGVTVPAVVRHGVVETAANIDQGWIGTNAESLFGEALGCPVTVLNDADAAGLAEVRWGAGFGHDGVVLMLTFGTGIGSALFVDGKLVPNTELGHLELDGKGDAERWASAGAREAAGLSFRRWAKRLQRYLTLVHHVIRPDLIVVGGGVSDEADKFLPYIDLPVPIVPATMHNLAGIVGAALVASERS